MWMVLRLLNVAALIVASVWWGTKLGELNRTLPILAFLATFVGTEIKSRGQDDRTAADRKLLEELNSIVTPRALDFFRHLTRAFVLEDLDLFSHLADDWKNDPNRRFHDQPVEKKRLALIDAINRFRDYVGEYTFDMGNGRQGPDFELKRTNPKLFYDVVNEMEARADNVLKAHEDFVSTAKKRLHV